MNDDSKKLSTKLTDKITDKSTNKLSYLEHLLELKKRLLKVLCFFIIAFGVSYYYAEDIFNFLLTPLSNIAGNRRIIYTGLAEVFLSYIKLSFLTAISFTMPILVYQIYRFIAPGLYKRERRIASMVLFFSPILFWVGSIFVFYLVMPNAWRFFLSFESTNSKLPLILEARISEYLHLTIVFMFAFGLAFQLPIVMIILSLIKLINSKTLQKYRRFAIVINFAVAAILTPPDVFSQIALAVPLILLYEVTIIIIKFIDINDRNN